MPGPGEVPWPVMSERPDHYFSADPASPEERQQVRVRLDGRELALTTARGVYSPDRLDPGTAVLLSGAPDPSPNGHLLDLGCGWGPIAITLALRSPGAHVWGVDVNRRALQLAALNAGVAGVGNITFCEPDEVPADVRFETIWSNPRSTSARLPCTHSWSGGSPASPLTAWPISSSRSTSARTPSRSGSTPRTRVWSAHGSRRRSPSGSSRSGDTDVRDPRGPAEPRASPVTAAATPVPAAASP